MTHPSPHGVLLLTGLMLLPGCGAQPTPQSPEERHLKALAVLVGQYRGSHKGQPPANIEALKAHVRSAQSQLKALGVDPANIDALFISTRDNKPFVYRPSKSAGGVPAMTPDGKPIPTVVLHEADGVGGRRWVVYELGQLELVDADRFKQLVPNTP